MKAVTQTEVVFELFGYDHGTALLAEIGYDGLDYSMFTDGREGGLLAVDDFEARAKALRRRADECGIPYTQAHAPFPSFKPGEDAYNAAIRVHIERALVVAGILGARAIVVHPITLPQNQLEVNLDFYESLAPLCRTNGVKIALENMFGWDKAIDRGTPGACGKAREFIRYLDALPGDCFTACLDIGHVGIAGEFAPDAIRALGQSRLTALHVHDNDNHYDLHQLPYLHDLKWDAITAALREIRYTGDLTMEADNFLLSFPKELVPDASRLMLAVARHLAQLSSADPK